jgi:hypothetical protein
MAYNNMLEASTANIEKVASVFELTKQDAELAIKWLLRNPDVPASEDVEPEPFNDVAEHFRPDDFPM